MKKRLTIVLAALMFCFIPHVSLGQQAEYDADVYVPIYPGSFAPGGNVITEGVQTSVDYNRGIAHVGVPLYVIESGNLLLPISLNYTTVGVKVDDPTPWTGMGWRLSAGGQITRIIKDGPDEDDTFGYLGLCSELSRLIPDMNSGTFDLIYTNDFDTEPDIFRYDIPGKSGVFMFDGQISDGKYIAHCLPHQNVKIEWVINATENYFVLTDSDGTVYEFGKGGANETTYWMGAYKNLGYGNSYSRRISDYTCISAWYLNDIENLNGDNINFNYGDEVSETVIDTVNMYTFYYERDNSGYGVANPSLVVDNERGPNVYESIVTKKYLTDITYGGGKAYFNALGAMVGYDHLGDIMFVSTDSAQNESLIFGVLLEYDNSLGRRMLSKVTKFQGDDDQIIAKFDYHNGGSNTPLPAPGSYTSDMWGYYTGQKYANDCPRIDIFPDSFANNIIRPMVCNSEAMLKGTLREITTTTGQKIELAYDKHSGNVGGPRIMAISSIIDGVKNSTTYSYDAPQILGDTSLCLEMSAKRKGDTYIYSVKNLIASKFLNNPYDVDGAAIRYNSVTEKFPNGSYIVRTFHRIDDDYATMSKVDNDALILADNTLGLRSSRFFERGLIKDESYFSAAEPGITMSAIKKVEYSYRFSSGNNMLRGFSFIKTKKESGWVGWYIAAFDWRLDPVYLTQVKTTSLNHGPASIVKYEYDEDKMALTKMTTTSLSEASGNTTETTIKYNYDLPGTREGRLYTNNNVITPIETTIKRGGKVIGGELQIYGYVQAGSGPGAVERNLPAKFYKLAIARPVSDFQAASTSGGGILFDRRYQLTKTVTGASEKGVPLTRKTHAGNESSMVLNGLGNEIIAAAENVFNGLPVNFDGETAPVRKSRVFHTSFEDAINRHSTDKAKTGVHVYDGSYSFDDSVLAPGLYVLTYWESRDQGANWTLITDSAFEVTGNQIGRSVGSAGVWIDEVRILPVDGRITTYTYEPGKGKTSEMDHNGLTTYWEYDDLGRVSRILNDKRQVVKAYEYNVKNQ